MDQGTFKLLSFFLILFTSESESAQDWYSLTVIIDLFQWKVRDLNTFGGCLIGGPST